MYRRYDIFLFSVGTTCVFFLREQFSSQETEVQHNAVKTALSFSPAILPRLEVTNDVNWFELS